MRVPDWMRIRLQSLRIGFQLSLYYALLFVLIGILLNLSNEVRTIVLILWIATGPMLAGICCLALTFVFPDLVGRSHPSLLVVWTYSIVFASVHFVVNSIFIQSLLGLLRYCRDCYSIERFPFAGYLVFVILAGVGGAMMMNRLARQKPNED